MPGTDGTGELPADEVEESPADEPAEDEVEGEPLGLAGRTRHRGVLWAGVTVIILFVGGLLLALLGSRGNADAVPGTDAVDSLAVIQGGYLVGTTGGLAVSPDGRTWSIAHLPQELVAVSASDGNTAYVLAGGILHSTTDLRTYSNVASNVAGTVITAGVSGTVDVGRTDHLLRVAPGGAVDSLPAGLSEPSGLRGLALSPSDPDTILAAGPVAGLWETTDGAGSWHQLLRTPIQALLIDAQDAHRVFIGTEGGVLMSPDAGRTWRFTSLRLNVEGLAQQGGRIYAIGNDRVIYSSADGVTGWSAVVSG